MNYKSALCCCIICHDIKSAKGIFSHHILAHTEEGNKTSIQRGKIGGNKSREYSANIKANNIATYLNNPTKCKKCENVLPYELRNNKFCNSSCAAIYNNLGSTKIKYKCKILHNTINSELSFKCLYCSTEHKLKKSTSNKYCNNLCQQNHFLHEKIQNGVYSSKTVKRYLLLTNGYKCWECGISKWNGKRISLELEHVDGNSDNNNLSNLSILCPNCHSQTPTYKSKNKGNGRHYRRVRYREGKSF